MPLENPGINLRIIRTLVFLSFVLTANLSFGQQEFLNELGTEKANSFQKLIDSYRNFLNLNYPNTTSLGEQTRKFMTQVVNGQTLKYDSIDAIDLIKALELTELRKDISLYREELYGTRYDVRHLLTEDQADEIDENITLNYSDRGISDSLERDVSYIEKLPADLRRIERELEAKRMEARKWGTRPNPTGLYHYALLKSDTSFYVYCLARTMGISIAITPALTELADEELESWNTQLIFIVDYYLEKVLFRFRRYM